VVFQIQSVFAASEPDALVGPVDIEGDDSNPQAPSLLVACQSRLNNESEPGFIARVALCPTTGPVSWRRMDMSGWPNAAGFHPIGISLVAERGLLYVVNRVNADDHRIEVFAVESREVRHLDSLVDPVALRNPSDVAASADGTILVTNAHDEDSLVGSLWQDVRGKATGTIALFEPNTRTWRIVADGLPSPNGVVIDAAQALAHVAMTMEGTVRTFRIEGTTLTPAGRVRVGGRPDNVSWDCGGKLLVTVHDSGTRFLLHALMGGKTRSPGHVCRIDPGNAAVMPEAVLRNDGKAIGSVSVAVRRGGRIYVGQVLGAGIGVASES